jgi:hypothetical protein
MCLGQFLYALTEQSVDGIGGGISVPSFYHRGRNPRDRVVFTHRSNATFGFFLTKGISEPEFANGRAAGLRLDAGF